MSMRVYLESLLTRDKIEGLDKLYLEEALQHRKLNKLLLALALSKFDKMPTAPQVSDLASNPNYLAASEALRYERTARTITQLEDEDAVLGELNILYRNVLVGKQEPYILKSIYNWAILGA